VRVVDKLMPPKAATRDCPNCVSSILIGAEVWPFCTRELAPVAAA
jgi:endogenous inhibitor of DNA gyrase (YacG/DUF329 family)